MSPRPIFHITGMRSTKFGSLEHYFLELTRRCNDTNRTSIFQYEQYPESQNYVDQLHALGAQIIVFKIHGTPFYNSLFQIAKHVHFHRPEIINTHFAPKWVLLGVPIIAKALAQAKSISTVHSYDNLRRNSLLSRAYNRYQYVIGVSSSIAENLRNAGVKPHIASFNYLGLFGYRERSLDERKRLRKALDIPFESPVIACIAFDTHFKGLDVLLKSFHKLFNQQPICYLVVIGVDPRHSLLPGIAKDFGIADRVRWPGIVDNAWKFLNCADIYVQPSRYGEGLTLSIMESMALGLPAVVSRIPGLSEAVIDGKSGYLCEPDNADSLAKILIRLLNEPYTWEIFGRTAHQRYISLFRGDVSIDRLLKLYYKMKPHRNL